MNLPIANAFQLTTETPSELIVRLNLAKDENVDKFGGRFWHKQRADGSWAFLASIVDCVNIKTQGRTIKSEKLINANVEVRVPEDDLQNLLEGVEDMETRVVEVKLLVRGEIILKTLTLKTGEKAKNIYVPADITGIRQGTSNLSSDDFESEEDIDAFLEENVKKNLAGRDAYRAAQQMANETANQSENVLA